MIKEKLNKIHAELCINRLYLERDSSYLKEYIKNIKQLEEEMKDIMDGLEVDS